MLNKALLVKGGALATVGAGLLLLRQVGARTRVAAVVAEYPEVVRSYPALCESVSALSEVGDVRSIMENLDEIHRNDVRNRTPQSPWRITREIAKVQEAASILCDPKRAVGQEKFRSVMYVQTDVLPDLERHLENLLHNHLLDPVVTN